MSILLNIFRIDRAQKAKRRFLRTDYDNLVSRASQLAFSLEALVANARGRLRLGNIMETDVVDLIKGLHEACSAQVVSRPAEDSASAEYIVFDEAEHRLFVAPSANLVIMPQAVMAQATQAVEAGATNAALVLELMTAEIDVVLQRWRLAIAQGLVQKSGNSALHGALLHSIGHQR